MKLLYRSSPGMARGLKLDWFSTQTFNGSQDLGLPVIADFVDRGGNENNYANHNRNRGRRMAVTSVSFGAV